MRAERRGGKREGGRESSGLELGEGGLTSLLGFTSTARDVACWLPLPLMQDTVLTTVAATGFTVAFFHAAIPTHWLPFVLVARARNWSRSKALAVTALAGIGHVLLTSLLGLIIAYLGFQLDERFGEVFPWLAGGLLIAF